MGTWKIFVITGYRIWHPLLVPTLKSLPQTINTSICNALWLWNVEPSKPAQWVISRQHLPPRGGFRSTPGVYRAFNSLNWWTFHCSIPGTWPRGQVVHVALSTPLPTELLVILVVHFGAPRRKISRRLPDLPSLPPPSSHRGWLCTVQNTFCFGESERTIQNCDQTAGSARGLHAHPLWPGVNTFEIRFPDTMGYTLTVRIGILPQLDARSFHVRGNYCTVHWKHPTNVTTYLHVLTRRIKLQRMMVVLVSVQAMNSMPVLTGRHTGPARAVSEKSIWTHLREWLPADRRSMARGQDTQLHEQQHNNSIVAIVLVNSLYIGYQRRSFDWAKCIAWHGMACLVLTALLQPRETQRGFNGLANGQKWDVFADSNVVPCGKHAEDARLVIAAMAKLTEECFKSVLITCYDR